MVLSYTNLDEQAVRGYCGHGVPDTCLPGRDGLFCLNSDTYKMDRMSRGFGWTTALHIANATAVSPG